MTHEPGRWDSIGTGATVQDESVAGEAIREALRNLVRDPYAYHKKNRLYLGTVASFFPRSSKTLAGIQVFWNPTLETTAAQVVHDTKHGFIEIGKGAFRLRRDTSLGASFLHEVEHLHDLLEEKNFPVEDGKAKLSEFTPRLRQMVRQLKDEPDFRIWNYLGRHGRDHAANYVSNHLHGLTAYSPDHQATPEQVEFAINSVIERAREIYSGMNVSS